ncbi:hypothetical protein [Duganella sp. BuS-21]|uniref:hypothetical protein n=1 Tax=Duganella sp. BuS-21 TaxID=2943848 RepID=UPI0035A7324F
MTAISISYKKNTTGEIYPPISAFRISYLRPDGRPATGDDIAKIHDLMAQATSHAYIGRGRKGNIEPEWSDGGYRVEVERDDGLPMTFADVQACILTESLDRLDARGPVEVVTISKVTLAAMTRLTLVGVQAWSEAVQQLQPESDDQVVTLQDPEGAQALIDAGLIDCYDVGGEIQYVLPRMIAYCSIEQR